MSRAKYHEARKELVLLVSTSLMHQTAQKANKRIIAEEFREMFDKKSEDMLDTFEEIVDCKRLRLFWFGVLQSLVAAFIFSVCLALLALALYGSRLNLVDILTNHGQTPPTSKQNASP